MQNACVENIYSHKKVTDFFSELYRINTQMTSFSYCPSFPTYSLIYCMTTLLNLSHLCSLGHIIIFVLFFIRSYIPIKKGIII
jgi:hypothetical protein